MRRSAHYFKWTPEAVARLRQLAGHVRSAEIAAEFGCTQTAVNSRVYDLGLTKKHNPAICAYARLYQCDVRIVRKIGVDCLDKMSDSARALLLRKGKPLGKKNSEPRTPKQEPRSLHRIETLRVERMMQLSRKAA